jgi:acetylornithine deacetylase
MTDHAGVASTAARIDQLIERHRGQAVTWLRELVALDSEAPRERAAQHLLAEFANAVGLDARLLAADGDGELGAHPRFVETGMSYDDRPNCVITMANRTGPAIVCNAHIDTVAVGDGWVRNPHGQLEDGRLYGRGTCDSKASLVSALLAATCLDELGDESVTPIEIHSVIDEEPGGNGTLSLLTGLQREAAHRAPRMAVVMEPTRLDLVTGHRGMLWYGLTCVGKQAHGSTALGLNSIEQAADVVQSLRALNESYSTWPGGPYGPPRLNVGIVRGGQEVYTTPGLCTLEVSVRYAPGQRNDVASTFLEAVQSALPADQVEVSFCRDFEASDTDPHSPEVVAALAALRKHRPNSGLSTLAGTCDMRHYRREWNVPSVVFGPGDLAVAHTPAEFVDLDDMFVAARVLAELAVTLAVAA